MKDIILVSDLDGTILPITGIISQKNMDAIAKFRKLGGTFAVATGRSPLQALTYLEQLEIDGAVIANNGGIIFNPKTKEILWAKLHDCSYMEAVEDIMGQFPQVGIVAVTSNDQYHLLTENKISKEFEERAHIKLEQANEENLLSNCSKVLLRIEETELWEVFAYIEKRYHDRFQVINSGTNWIELMPLGISKGFPFERLVTFYDKKLENSVAIGDYNNDVEMIEKASIGVAVENALDSVKAVANLVVKSCEEDGIADLITYLINHSE